MAGAPTNHLNKPYANMYSATDPRFFFPNTIADGSIMYYSSVYNKWTGSNASTLNWNDVTNTLEATNVKSSKFIVKDSVGVNDMELTNPGGSVKFASSGLSSSVTIRNTGQIRLEGSASGIIMLDRSTSDNFQIYTTGGVFTIVSNFFNYNFELTTSGIQSLQGTSAGLRLYNRTASPSDFFEFFTDTAGTSLNLTYNGTSIATVSSTGITTLVPQKLQTTLTTTNATYFIPFVPLSSTQVSGQVFGTDGGLTYNPSNNSFEVVNGTITAPTFVGLASNATAITTTTQPAATTYFLTMANAGTGGTGKSIFVDTDITWNNGTNTLSVTNVSGLASSATAITTTTQPAATTYFLTMANAGTGGTSKSIFVDTGITWNNGTGTLTATNFGGLASSASTITTSTAGAGTFFPVFTTAGTGGTSRVLSVDTGLSYVASSDTLTCANFVGSLSGSCTLVDTTNNTGASAQFLTFVPLSSTQTAGQTLSTSSSLGYVPSTGTLTTTVLSASELIVSDTLAFNDTFTPANQFVLSHTNGILQFNNEWSPLAIPLQVDGDGGGVTIFNLQAQAYEPSSAVELDSPSISAAGDNGVLFEASTTNDYSAIPTQTGTTWTIVVSGYNPNSRELTFSFGVTSQHDLNCGGTAGLSQSFAPTFGSVTCTRNGGGFVAFTSTSSTASGTSFAYSTTNVSFLNTYRVTQPLTQYTIKFIPSNSTITDTYVFTFPITYAYTSTTGYAWTTVSTTRNPTDFTYSFARQPGGIGVVNFTAGASPAGTSMISAMTLTKDLFQTSTRTLACDYLQAEYIGLVGDYTLSGTTGTFLRCFRGGYDHYEITLRLTAAPTLGTRFTVQPATSGGTASTTGYFGSMSSLGSGSTLLVSYGVTTGAILFTMAAQQGLIYTAKIYSPNISRATTFQATNIGSDATHVNVPVASCGFHTVTTSYPSLVWTTTNSINANLTIRGFS